MHRFKNIRPPITRKNTTKILGLNIDNHLKFHTHIKTKHAIARKALSSLFRFRTAAIKTKLHLYNAFILPLLTYCPLALLQTKHSNILSLQRIQNRAFRFIHDTHWQDFTTSETLHTRTDRPPLNIVWHTRTLKQINKFPIYHQLLTEKLIRLSLHRRRNPNSLNLLSPEVHPMPEPIYK